MRPLPVSQALRTTKSALSFNLSISSAVSKALSLLLGVGAKAIALFKAWKLLRIPWVARWIILAWGILDRTAVLFAASPVSAFVPNNSAIASASSLAPGKSANFCGSSPLDPS